MVCNMPVAAALVDGLHINNITIIDVVADRLEFCRVNLKKPPAPLSWMSRRSGLLATCGVPILRQRPHRSFHRVAVLPVLTLCQPFPVYPGGLNRSTQHFILEGKDGVWDGTEIS